MKDCSTKIVSCNTGCDVKLVTRDPRHEPHGEHKNGLRQLLRVKSKRKANIGFTTWENFLTALQTWPQRTILKMDEWQFRRNSDDKQWFLFCYLLIDGFIINQ